MLCRSPSCQLTLQHISRVSWSAKSLRIGAHLVGVMSQFGALPTTIQIQILLVNLHWLPVHKRINVKVATHSVQGTVQSSNVHAPNNNQQPAYLHNLTSYHQSSRFLCSSCQSLLHVPRIKTDFGEIMLSPLLLHKSVTVGLYTYCYQSESHHHLTSSNVTSKLTTLHHHTLTT